MPGDKYLFANKWTFKIKQYLILFLPIKSSDLVDDIQLIHPIEFNSICKIS